MSPQVGELDEDAFAQAMAQEPDAALTLLAEMATATDERLRAAARRLAARIALDQARRGPADRRGVARLRTRRGADGGDLDVDASLETIIAARAAAHLPDPDELHSRVWTRPPLAVCLVIDRSGSMGGARLAAAALTAAACAWRAPAEHAVVSFAAEAQVLRPMASARPAVSVIDQILMLRGHGTTSIAAALRTAADQLGRSRAARRVVVLLSDCRSTDDSDDPLPIARRLPELVIVAPGDDTAAAADFAAAADARWAALTGPASAPAVLAGLLSPGGA